MATTHRCTATTAHSWFVAHGGPGHGPLLELAGGPEEKRGCRSSPGTTWPLVREGGLCRRAVATAPVRPDSQSLQPASSSSGKAVIQ